METFDVSSITKNFMRYTAHPMLAISFENSKKSMLGTWLECLLNVVRNNRCLMMISLIGLLPSGARAKVQ